MNMGELDFYDMQLDNIQAFLLACWDILMAGFRVVHHETGTIKLVAVGIDQRRITEDA
jgi:hypothetical protein